MVQQSNAILPPPQGLPGRGSVAAASAVCYQQLPGCHCRLHVSHWDILALSSPADIRTLHCYPCLLTLMPEDHVAGSFAASALANTVYLAAAPESLLASCHYALLLHTCRNACDDNMREAVLSFHVWEGLQRAISRFGHEMHTLASRMKDDTHSKLQHLLLPMLVNDYWVQQPQ